MIDKSLFTLPKVGMVMGVLLVLSLAQAACLLGQGYALARAITNLWEGGVLADQAMLAATFAACFVGKQLLVFVRDSYLARFSQERACELRDALLEGVFGSRNRLVSRTGSAAVSQAALDGVDQVETYLGLILPKIVGLVAIPLPLLVAVFALDWVSGLILLVFFPVIIFFMILIGRQASARAASQYESYNALSNHFIDTLRGIETLRLFGRSKAYGERIFASSEDFRMATIDTLKVATLSSGVLDLIATLGVAAVSLMLGFRLLDGTILLFPALIALILSPEYFKPVRDFAGDFHASLDGKNALAGIVAMVALAQEQGDSGDVPLWSENSCLRFSQVDFVYDTAASDDVQDAALGSHDFEASPLAALKGIDFEARGFAKIGVVGISGSGKSTLVNLIGGFARPSNGCIEVDGKRIEDLGTPSWQKQLLYVPQDPYLFHATLRENICFYTPEATEASLETALDACGLRELVTSLPDGLDTLIGEGGRGLSGGQAQRIALARALLDPTRKILLFDEPTAHLDIETEWELKERMLTLMEGHLVFFATHRLHWLADMDRILVLEDGQLAESGTLEELMAKDGVLVRLVSKMNRGDAA